MQVAQADSPILVDAEGSYPQAVIVEDRVFLYYGNLKGVDVYTPAVSAKARPVTAKEIKEDLRARKAILEAEQRQINTQLETMGE